MSTESHNSGPVTGEAPRNTDVSFEERDVQVNTIYGYLFALALAVVVSAVICVFILRFTTNFAASSHTAPPPSRAALGLNHRDIPPEPQLQGFGFPGQEADPQADLRKKTQADNEANEKFEWIDKNSGVAQIPVEDAMKIIAEKGLPAVPAPPAEKKK
jgi:hypothetical protein